MDILNRKEGTIIKCDPILIGDTIQSMRPKINFNSENIDSNLENIENAISEVHDNDYIKKHMSGIVIGRNATITGRFISQFGENLKDSLQIREEGVIIQSEHSLSNLGKEGGFIFTVDEIAKFSAESTTYTDNYFGDSDSDSEEGEIPLFDLTDENIYKNIKQDEIFIIKIGDLANIICAVKLGIVGNTENKTLVLDSLHPSITLMKCGESSNSRFVVLSYPNMESSSGGGSIKYLEERVNNLEKQTDDMKQDIEDIGRRLVWQHID